MTESYFQIKCREQLTGVRDWFEEVQDAIRNNPEYARNEQRAPGRIAHLMDQAASYLDDAECMIPALTPSPQQKALWVAFRKTLDLAYRSMSRALRDPSITRDDVRQEGTRKLRHPEINEWIEQQLHRQPDAKSPVLWDRRPEYISDPREYEPIQFEAFARRVTAVRGKLGLKRKKTTSSN